MEKISFIDGEVFTDNRGLITSNNSFNLNEIKRMYTIYQLSTKVIRACQRHLLETKYFKCIKDEFIVTWKGLANNFPRISDKDPEFKILNDNCNQIIKILNVYADGVKAREKNSSILVFSDFELNESLNNEIRFDKNLWLVWSKILIKRVVIF